MGKINLWQIKAQVKNMHVFTHAPCLPHLPARYSLQYWWYGRPCASVSSVLPVGRLLLSLTTSRRHGASPAPSSNKREYFQYAVHPPLDVMSNTVMHAVPPGFRFFRVWAQLRCHSGQPPPWHIPALLRLLAGAVLAMSLQGSIE